MASRSPLNSTSLNIGSVLDTPAGTLPYVATIALVVLLYYLCPDIQHDIPILNGRKPHEFTERRAKLEFVSGARRMVRQWFDANPKSPVRLTADFGKVTLLPPSMTQEIRSDKRLSFSKWTYNAFHARFPGFEGFREGSRDSHVVQAVITKDLTKLLNKITEPLADETALALRELLPCDEDWHTIPLRDNILRLVARISSRVFLGTELCRDEAWLRITREYTITAFIAAEQLRMWPSILRPIVHWFLPTCRKARAQVEEARHIIGPVLERRKKLKLELKATGAETKQFDDAIEWFEQTSKGQHYDPATAQLVMSLAAIHTTTDLTCQTLTDIMQHPEILQPLREEALSVLRENGWQKASLYKMKLLDSVIKESQRLKPTGTVAMRRMALEDLKLSDGTTIRKNQYLAVSAHEMWNPEVYQNPGEWDGYRFYNMRDIPGRQNAAQLVATSPEHLGFGHGQHACPGRFFAANEVKIALIHLLLGYNWNLPDGVTPSIRQSGFSLGADPLLEVRVRRRQDEMQI